MTNLKKYTNADFYKNGVFQQEIAIEKCLSTITFPLPDLWPRICG